MRPTYSSNKIYFVQRRTNCPQANVVNTLKNGSYNTQTTLGFWFLVKSIRRKAYDFPIFILLMSVILSEPLWVETSRRTLCRTIINETKSFIRFHRVRILFQVEDLTIYFTSVRKPVIIFIDGALRRSALLEKLPLHACSACLFVCFGGSILKLNMPRSKSTAICSHPPPPQHTHSHGTFAVTITHH